MVEQQMGLLIWLYLAVNLTLTLYLFKHLMFFLLLCTFDKCDFDYIWADMYVCVCACVDVVVDFLFL